MYCDIRLDEAYLGNISFWWQEKMYGSSHCNQGIHFQNNCFELLWDIHVNFSYDARFPCSLKYLYFKTELRFL